MTGCAFSVYRGFCTFFPISAGGELTAAIGAGGLALFSVLSCLLEFSTKGVFKESRSGPSRARASVWRTKSSTSSPASRRYPDFLPPDREPRARPRHTGRGRDVTGSSHPVVSSRSCPWVLGFLSCILNTGACLGPRGTLVLCKDVASQPELLTSHL